MKEISLPEELLKVIRYLKDTNVDCSIGKIKRSENQNIPEQKIIQSTPLRPESDTIPLVESLSVQVENVLFLFINSIQNPLEPSNNVRFDKNEIIEDKINDIILNIVEVLEIISSTHKEFTEAFINEREPYFSARWQDELYADMSKELIQRLPKASRVSVSDLKKVKQIRDMLKNSQNLCARIKMGQTSKKDTKKIIDATISEMYKTIETLRQSVVEV